MARVLIIDDTRANRELVEFILTRHGHQVDCAGSVAGGLAAARRERPDLVLVDLDMPVLDGFAGLAALRAEPALQGVTVAAVSVHDGWGPEALRCGYVDFIALPLEVADFVGRVEGLLPEAVGG